MIRELIDTELEAVAGGVFDLGAYITKAVDNALGAAIGGKPGNAPGGIDPGMTPRQPLHLIQYANPAVL